MSDFGSPVAQNVNVNPQQGIQTLSGLIGLQRQNVGLQQQQQELATQTATAQQAQQTARQRSGIAAFMQNFDPTQHVGPDGTLDLDGVFGDPKLRAAAGDQFPQLMQQMLQVKQSQLEAKSKLAGLNDSVRNQFMSMVGGLRTDPDVVEDNPAGRKKVQDAIGQFEATGPDAARVGQIYEQAFNHAPQGKLAQVVSNAQLQGMDAAAQAGRQAPTYAAAGGELVQTNPQAAGGTGGSGIRVTLAPGEQPATKGAQAAATEAASGGAARDVERANQVSAAQKNASALLPLTHEVDRLSHEIMSGHLAAMTAGGANYLGFSSVAEARTQLQKDLGLLKGPLAAQAGSDQRAASILEGYPTDTTPENTTHAAMDYIRGTFRQTMARGELLKKNGQNGFAAADDALTRSTDPLVYEAASLKKGQPNGFYKRNFGSAQEAQEFKDRVDALRKHTSYVGGDDSGR